LCPLPIVGGNLIALRRCENRVCEHSVLGPIDPQLGIRTAASSSPRLSGESLWPKSMIEHWDLADVGARQLRKFSAAESDSLTRRLARRTGRLRSQKNHLRSGRTIIPIMGLDREVAWPLSQHRYAGRCPSTVDALSTTRSQCRAAAA